MVLNMENFTSINNNSIYSSSHNNNQATSILAYTLSGEIDIEDNDVNLLVTSNGEQICAKTISRIDGSIKHMIRIDSNNKFYNPISIYGTENNKTFLDRICRSNQKFREVSEKTLNFYVKFLQSKNILWLNNAEREAE
jgi:hypothetical protein